MPTSRAYLHAVGDVELRAVVLGVGLVQHRLDQSRVVHGQHAHVVALALQLLQDPVERERQGEEVREGRRLGGMSETHPPILGHICTTRCRMKPPGFHP